MLLREYLRLIIVRHGETEENVKGIVQGQTHGKLTEKGRKQVKELALTLKNTKLDAIFSSDLRRAVDTADEIAKYHKLKVRRIKILRERHAGTFHRKLHDEMSADQVASGLSKAEYRPRGGESLVDLKKRVAKFAKELYKNNNDKTVLVVTHGFVIKCMYSFYLDVPLIKAADMKTRNAGMLVLDVGKSRVSKVKDTVFA